MRKLLAIGYFFALASAISLGQARDPEAGAAVASGVRQMTTRQPVLVDLSQPYQTTVGSDTVFDLKTGRVVGQTTPKQGEQNPSNLVFFGGPGTIDGLNTVDTFDGAFAAGNGPSQGNLFRFSMMGNYPLVGGETFFPAQIDEVSLQLLNPDGSTFTTVPYQPFERHTLRSPNFALHDYSSGHDIQYGDAQLRAEFFNRMRPDWHTTLLPSVVNRVTIPVPYFVNVQLPNGHIVKARAYFTGKASDGSTFVLMLDLLFNFFFDNEVINEINLGNFVTNGVNMTMFPNTYLFSLNLKDPNKPGNCCVLGFHTYFLDTSVPQDRWITLYASWISPGIFGGGFEDVTGLSHELSESYNDPFIDNVTPIWQFPGEPANSKNCQGNLEVGDPVEVLANATTPVTIGSGSNAFTYHPQDLALLQWFEMLPTSNAINGAFSFPNATLLPASAKPCPK